MEAEKYVSEVTERYVYEVIKRLPPSQKEDIENELRGLIEDMLAARAETPYGGGIDAVVSELGKPSALADKFRDAKKHLVGPAYFDIYILVLKIVLAVTALGMTVAVTVGYFVEPPAGIPEALLKYVSAVIAALFQAFGCITIAFALVERYDKKSLSAPKENWTPKDLPPMPAPGAVIKKGEPIVGIVFAVLAAILFNFAPQLVGVYAEGYAPSVIPLFNMDTYYSVLPLINLSLGIGLLKELSRLIAGRYTIKLAIATAVFNIVSLVLVLLIFTDQNLWNRGFAESVKAAGVLGISADFDLAYYLGIAAKVVIGLFIFGTVVDTITALCKGIRHDDHDTINEIFKESKADSK